VTANPEGPSPINAVVGRAEITEALEAEQFVLHFQPIVRLQDLQPIGTEALIRWDHPALGLLPPDAFLPAVAQTPVMRSITKWVLRAACAAAARWPGWTVSVNISARDLSGDTLTQDVIASLDSAGISPTQLVLELTETALVQDLLHAAALLGQLRTLGVGIALDDFGTGYSSMLYLRELPVSSVKIDRVFTNGLLRSADDMAIVTSLLTLARTIGLDVVAEGVETEAQAQRLHLLGCPLAQGYLWSRPQAASDIDALHRDGLPLAAPARASWRRHRPPSVDSAVLARAQSLLARGASLRTIAAALNAAGERTEQGTRWHPATVAKLINSALPPR
jgi:EAL domain-containing protein (putative c-di-GMP-specific phosphodiesterase class I)